MLKAIITLGGLGFFLSVILSVAYARLAIKVSLKEKQIRDALPGANCGGCGFPGCDGYASALAEGTTELGLCPVLDVGGRSLLSQILGAEVAEVEPKVAILKCCGASDKTYEKVEYIGMSGCSVAKLVVEGPKSCRYGCIGFGDCVFVCQFGAIKIGAAGLPIIDEKLCTGCGKCVTACPQNLIELVPEPQKVYVGCVSLESIKLKKEHCKSSCTGCKLCEKNCPYKAIKVDVVARVNFDSCQNCGICVKKCPTGAIVDKLEARPKAMIGMRCSGCEKCKEVCPMGAISGESGKQHKVDFSKCVGCSLCYKVCEPEAITIAFSLGYSV